LEPALTSDVNHRSLKSGCFSDSKVLNFDSSPRRGFVSAAPLASATVLHLT
jgi:hypothetical protein